MPGLRRELLGLAWPIVISRSTQTVVGLCDAFMVAHLGAAALAATTTGAMNTFTALILPMGICFIVSSFASQLHGAGDGVGARRYGWYGLGLAAITQLVCLCAILVVDIALRPLGYAADVHGPMASYIEVRLLSGGAAIGLEALGNYYGGLGNTRLPMIANLLAMTMNLVGNYLLIDGHFGMPALGVRGAAWASVFATSLAFVFLLVVFLRDGASGWRPIGLTFAEFRRMLRFGIPSGFNWFFEFLAFMFFVNVVVGGLGTPALAALMAVIQINSFSFMPAFGIASAGAILVGQRIGSGDRDGVTALVRVTFTTAAAWQLSVGLCYFLFPEALFSPFAAGEAVEAAALLAVGARLLMLSSLWQLFDSALAVLAESLRAAGDTAFPLWARLGVSWLFFVPGSWFTIRELGWDIDAAVGWIVAYLGLLSAILWVRFRSGAWRNIALVDGAPSG